MNLNIILTQIPECLRIPLIDEYNRIIQHYLERRWTASELSGGKFCEIVFSILDGHAKGVYSAAPFKPANFPDACKKLENNSNEPRSFQILIPRMLPPLYEIRNNRNVGHVGGDVDSNSMDAHAVLSISTWIMGEIIRVLHNVSVIDAQQIVDVITTRKMPLVWEMGMVKRILIPGLPLSDQILLLVSSGSLKTQTSDLLNWIEYSNKGYFLKSLRLLHKKRMIELSSNETEIEILPPGTTHIEKLILKLNPKIK